MYGKIASQPSFARPGGWDILRFAQDRLCPYVKQNTMTTSQSIAFLFPGQGSQAVGMGKELAEKYSVARQTFAEADEALGYKLSQLCFEGPEEKLRLTEITQPAILTASVAAWRVLHEKGVNPSFVAGHSLGEYSANVAAGTISFADAVRTVRNRGKYMQEAVPVGVGAMAAILGMDLEKVTQLCVPRPRRAKYANPLTSIPRNRSSSPAMLPP